MNELGDLPQLEARSRSLKTQQVVVLLTILSVFDVVEALQPRAVEYGKRLPRHGHLSVSRHDGRG